MWKESRENNLFLACARRHRRCRLPLYRQNGFTIVCQKMYFVCNIENVCDSIIYMD